MPNVERLFFMKNRIVSAIVIALLIAAGAAANHFGQKQVQAQAIDGVVRLHILAASDNPADQRRKLLVRDALLAVYGADLSACRSVQEAQATVTLLERDMLQTAAAALAGDGCAEAVSLEQVCEPFPTRVYADVVYPAGLYHAVRIKIGPAQGQNWWCVMYPPLCSAGYTFDAADTATGYPPGTSAVLPDVSTSEHSAPSPDSNPSAQTKSGLILDDEPTKVVVQWKSAEWVKRVIG